MRRPKPLHMPTVLHYTSVTEYLQAIMARCSTSQNARPGRTTQLPEGAQTPHCRHANGHDSSRRQADVLGRCLHILVPPPAHSQVRNEQLVNTPYFNYCPGQQALFTAPPGADTAGEPPLGAPTAARRPPFHARRPPPSSSPARPGQPATDQPPIRAVTSQPPILSSWHSNTPTHPYPTPRPPPHPEKLRTTRVPSGRVGQSFSR